MDLRKAFGKKLKVLRTSRGLTQDDLAERAGVSTSFISSLERGVDAPSFATLEALATALGVQVSSLFDFG